MTRERRNAMKIAIVGAGAIGGFLASRFARTGHRLGVVERGAQLEAIRERGLTVIDADGHRATTGPILATDRCDELGPQDVVVLGVKAYDLERVAPDLPPLFGRETVVVTLQNGLPWWYFHRHGGELEGRRLVTADPQGAIEAHVEGRRIVGCVAYPAVDLVEPGVIRHVEGDRFPLGEPDGTISDRCQELRDLLAEAGLRSRVLDDIRGELWLKALGTLSLNPLSALTHATMGEICSLAETLALTRRMMEEAEAVANRLGVRLRHPVERRLAGAQAVADHRTSMLQDVARGRPLETEALMATVIELARLVGLPCPRIEAIYAVVTLLERTYRRAGAAVRLLPEVAPVSARVATGTR
ncbi:MAG TPA: 2-dehydropantoate 2-reductase [Thermoanaerobaculia bacterium]|nr:2-dehydropantoate 2-reductase [Thermoanaerobaculia bacterium]